MGTTSNSNLATVSRLNQTERVTLTDNIYEAMERGVHSVNGLSKELGVARTTIRRYKPYADKRYEAIKINKPGLRALELHRAMRHREWLIERLEACKTIKEQMAVSNQIAKFSQLIAITGGIGTEAKNVTNIDYKQLVITRSHPDEYRQTLEEQNRLNNNQLLEQQ